MEDDGERSRAREVFGERGLVKGDKGRVFLSFASMCFLFFLPFNPRNTNGVVK